MFYAIQNGNEEIIKHILHDKDKNGQPILESLTLDDFNGKDANGNDAIRICCRNLYFYAHERINSNTLLFEPAENDDNEIVNPGPEKAYQDLIKKLIELGADCEGADSDGLTPLNYAIHSGNLELFRCQVPLVCIPA